MRTGSHLVRKQETRLQRTIRASFADSADSLNSCLSELTKVISRVSLLAVVILLHYCWMGYCPEIVKEYSNVFLFVQ